MITAVIVWEYCKDGVWLNFARYFSDLIEENFSKGYRSRLSLEAADSTVIYYVNLLEMTTILASSRETSTYFIRRNVFNKDSLPGKGIFWQWFCKDTKSWKDYHINVAIFLENISRSEKANCQVDLSLHFPNYNAIVDIKAMTHQEKTNGLLTPVQRVVIQPFMSKQVSTTLEQCNTGQTTANFNNMSQQVFNQPMQSYPPMPPNPPSGGSQQMTGLAPQGFTGSSMTVHQRLCTQNRNNVVAQIPCDQTIGVPPSGSSRKRTYDVSSVTAPFRYDMGYPNNSPSYYGFSSSQNLDPTQISQCRMLGRGENSNPQVQPNAQSFNLYMASNPMMQSLHSNSRKPMLVSSMRRKGRDGSSVAAVSSSGIELRNVIKAENYTTTFESVTEQGFIIVAHKYPSEHCAICFDNLDEKSAYGQSNSLAPDLVVYFKNCHHHFHKECLRAMYNAGIKNGSIQCPQCKAIYGTKRGNCPPGEMLYDYYNSSLPGHEGYGTIFIKYHVSGGIQGEEHPNPGKPYSTRGFPRCCYLPNNLEGQKVLKLLIIAWKRRLTFTVGCSVTTGESDTVVWNEIHHKTEERDVTGHGYPDPNYLKNVTEELAAHGVTESDED